MPITNTMRTILATAAGQPDRLATLPDRLPAAARQAVAQSMLRAELIVEVAADDDQPAWRTREDGQRFSLRITQAGSDAIGATLPVGSAVAATPEVPVRVTLRYAAQAILLAWDDPDDTRPALPAAIDALRATFVAPQRSVSAGERQPRPDTKRAAILALLRRSEGATNAQIMEATGWAQHTVHGFLAGLKKAGTPVEVLERVRQVGAGQGTKGSHTVYGIKGAN